MTFAAALLPYSRMKGAAACELVDRDRFIRFGGYCWRHMCVPVAQARQRLRSLRRLRWLWRLRRLRQYAYVPQLRLCLR